MSQLLTAELLQSQYADGRRNFQHVELIGALLSSVELQGIDLSGANLVGADLRGANLEGASLAGANLFGAMLHAARLGASLLEGANLQRAQLERADLKYATYNQFTRFSDNFDPAAAGMQQGGSTEVETDVPASQWMYRGRRPASTVVSAPSSTTAKPAASAWMYRGRLVTS
ncbi:MAG: pentapeptide repeat-containing protein [Cyanobacteria bacterium J06639_1]